jgi:hypothetical protein
MENKIKNSYKILLCYLYYIIGHLISYTLFYDIFRGKTYLLYNWFMLRSYNMQESKTASWHKITENTDV